MTVLVTGGMGYIGSHTCVELLEQGMDVVIVDNLVNSSAEAGRRVEQITDKKAVGESVAKPLEYYDNNLNSTIVLVQTMRKHNVKKIIFSSSATVYSGDNPMPLYETSRTGNCTNPYGWTKYVCEQVLRDCVAADPSWAVVLLRYFNPVGAHSSGLIGEDPRGIPNNLMPFISQTAIGRREKLSIFGNDYDTPDGTAIRDYIHVVDLAKAHVKAIEYAAAHKGTEVINIGTRKGYSVLQVLHAYEKACGHSIPYKIMERRPGDIATCYADTKKAEKLLGFKAQYDIDRMCEDSYRFTRNLEI